MKPNRAVLKITSIVLTLIILLTALPIGALAAESPSSTSTDDFGKRPLFDEKESLNTVIVDNGDGTKTLTLYDYPVRYINEEGDVKDISLEIVSSNGGSYKTKANDIKTVFPKKISDGIHISRDEVSIKLRPVMPTVEKWDASAKTIVTTATDSAVTFIDNKTVSYCYDSKTQIEYGLTYTGFKEDIVVSEYTGQTEYNFLLETGGLTLTEIDGSYYLIDSSGKTKATLGDIIILTADGVNNTMGNMTHTTVKENQLYILTIHIDAEWLQDEKTAYPIRIDPTVELTATGTSAIEDVTINSDGSSNGYETQLYIGKREGYGISRVLMSFPGLNLSDIPSFLHVISADVHLYDPVQETAAMDVCCYMFTGNEWTEASADWDDVNANSFTHYMAQDTVSWWRGKDYSPAHTYTFSILDYIKYVLKFEATIEQGILFKAKDSVENGSTNTYKRFSSYNSSTHKPYVTVTYSDTESNYAAPFGWFDSVTNYAASGWAWCVDTPYTPVEIQTYLLNRTTNETYGPLVTTAGNSRPDVANSGYGTGNYGFSQRIIWSDYPGGEYAVSTHAVNLDGVATVLKSDPKVYYNTGVYLNAKTVEMIKGNTHTLTLDYYDVFDPPATVWSSSDPAVASVSNGVITANKVGTAEITATVGNYSATCAVTVGTLDYSPSDLGISENKVYWIKEVETDNYLTISDGDWQSGSNICAPIPSHDAENGLQMTDLQLPYLYWKFEYSDFKYRFTSYNSLEMNVAVSGNGKANNTNVELCDARDDDMTAWKIVPSENGFKILSGASNYTKGLKIMSGNNVAIYDATIASEWEFVQIHCPNWGYGAGYAYGHALEPYATTYGQIEHLIPPGATQTFSDSEIDLVPDELSDSDCIVYKCADCKNIFIPPEMQDKFILSEDVYFSVLALQRAYSLNLIAGNLKQAEATMRIIDNIRSSYNGGSADGFYDFRDQYGDYVSNYKYQFDSYDTFYIEVSISENTDALVANMTLDALGRAIQKVSETIIDVKKISEDVKLLYNNLSSLISFMSEGEIYSFNDAFETLTKLMTDEIKGTLNGKTDKIIIKYLTSIGVNVNVGYVKYTVAGFKAAWELGKLIPDLMQLPPNNYMVNIVYGGVDSGWVFSGKYYYEDISSVYGEDGIEPTVDILHNSYGKFRFLYGAGTPSNAWYDIVGTMS